MKVLATIGHFDTGIGDIVEVDLAHGVIETKVSFTPPDSLFVAGKGFTGAAWSGVPGRSPLLVCGFCAVYRFDPETWKCTGTLHQPCMNDLHHVTVDGDRLLVSNTGLDRIDTFSAEGQFIGGVDLAPAWVSAARQQSLTPMRDVWERARAPGWDGGLAPRLDEAPADDYYAQDAGLPFHKRRTRDFVHPNHVALLGGRPIVTRFQDRCLQDLTTWDLVVPETPGYPHDGVVAEGVFWITCTNGLVIGYEIDRGRVTPRVLHRLDVFETTGHSGWCRGLFVTPELFVVGLTAIHRMPRYRWCDRPFEETESSVLAIERSSERLVARVDMSVLGERTKVFGLVGAP